jgi:hypothetical protein
VLFWPAVAIAYAKKRAIHRVFVNERGEPARIAKVAELIGSGHAMFLYGVVLMIAASRSRDPKLRAFARKFVKSGLLGFAVFQASRFVLAERRPKEGGRMRFFALHGHGVSGHAFAAALLHGPIMSAYGRDLSPRNRALLSTALYGWIAFIGWSRMRLDEHYLWNVLLAARIGLSVGRR